MIRQFSQLLIVPLCLAIKNIILILYLQYFLLEHELGILSQTLLVHSLTYIFISLNLTQALSRYLPTVNESNYRNESRIFWAVTIVITSNALIIGAIIYSGAELIQSLLYDQYTIKYFSLIIFCLIFLENLHNLIYCYFRSIGRFNLQSCSQFVRVAVEIIIILVGIAMIGSFEGKIELLLLLMILSLILSCIINYGVALHKSFLILVVPNFDPLKSYLKYSIPLIPASLGYWLISFSDRIFIANFLGLETLGGYFLANRLLIGLSFLLTPFSSIYTYRLSSGKPSRFFLALIIFLMCNCFAAFILYQCQPFIYNLFDISESNKQIIYTVIIPLIFSFLLFNAISALNIYRAVDMQQKSIGVEWVMMATLNVLLNLYLIPKFGVVGAAYSSMFSYIFGLLVIGSRTFISFMNSRK